MFPGAPDSAGGVVGGQAFQVLRVLRVWLKGHRANLLKIPGLWSAKVPSKVCYFWELYVFNINVSTFRRGAGWEQVERDGIRRVF